MSKFFSRKFLIFCLNYGIATYMLWENAITASEWMYITSITASVYMGANALAKFAEFKKGVEEVTPKG